MTRTLTRPPYRPGMTRMIILPYAGHGTFVTGVLRCAAPAAEIYCANVFNLAGSALEADAVPSWTGPWTRVTACST